MRSMIQALALVLIAAAMVGEAQSGERHRLAYSKKYNLEIFALDDGTGWCRDLLDLEMVAGDGDLYRQDTFQFLVRKIGALLDRDCPQAKGAEINGFEEEGVEPIFGATAMLSEKWALNVPDPKTETTFGLDTQNQEHGPDTAEQEPEIINQILLSEYPILSQKDPASYLEKSPLLSKTDYVSAEDGPYRPVPELACAATVYTMIERGNGRTTAVVDDFYEVGPGARPGRMKTASVRAMASLDYKAIKDSLGNGRPVVLRGEGGPLLQHYVLIVGWERMRDGKEALIANDPWPGKGVTRPGKQIRISASTFEHPLLPGIVFEQMRLVDRRELLAREDLTSQANPSAMDSAQDTGQADDDETRRPKVSFELYPVAPPLELGTRGNTPEKLQELRSLAEDGNAMAQLVLGLAYRDEYDDPGKALQWLERSANSGFDMAFHPLALLHTSGKLSGGPNYAEAYKWWSKAETVDASRVYGLRHIGWMYKEGLHVSQDFDEAEKRLKHAVDDFDDVWATMELALLYVDDRFARKDYNRALALFTGAAKKKYPHAYRHLAIMYQSGQGTAVNMAEAVKWYTAAYEAGDGAATAPLAWRHWRGEGAPKDPARAASLFDEAANAGDVEAQAQIGFIYYTGQGRPKDMAMAVSWFEKAAEASHVGAMRNLGVIYLKGEGVAKDPARAKGHLERAANKGDATSQYLLGLFYAGGYEGKPDMNEARNWYEKAAAQGYEPAKQNLEKLAKATRPEREDGEENSGQVVGLDAVQSEDSVPEGHSKDYVFKNFSCRKIGNNSHGLVWVYVDDNINLANLNIAKHLLDISGKYIKDNCPKINGYRNISVSIFKKSDMNKKPINVKNIDARNTNPDKLDWKRYYSNEFYKEHLINKKRQIILDFLEAHNVTNFVGPTSLQKNPFIYEGKVVAFEGKFERMLTRNEAIVAGVFLSNVPTEVFKTEGRFLIAGRVIGKKAVKSPFGGEIMLSHVEFADAFKGNYKYQDISWVESQFAN